MLFLLFETLSFDDFEIQPVTRPLTDFHSPKTEKTLSKSAPALAEGQGRKGSCLAPRSFKKPGLSREFKII